MIDWIKNKFRSKPKVYFTSDLHFSHKNVIVYCKRPFTDVGEMNESLVKQWNQQVKPQDTVYVLGDFSLNPKVASTFVKRLNGKKVLISGNHDATHISNKKADKFLTRYMDDGWEMVWKDYCYIQLKNGLNVVLCHLPYDNEFDSRYKEHKLPDQGIPLLHGHLHGHYIKSKNQIDVGWDAHHKLLTEDEVILLLGAKEEFIPSHLTTHYKERNDDKTDNY